ncbi:MAG: hypothetical protein Q9220_001030 [cf. Caloplaca sp. 1 TL-2023]
MAPQPSEADIIFNRANVALAKSQRLVASWLPPRTDEEARKTKTEEEIEREEKEMFVPVPEVLGLGAHVPDDMKDGDLKKQKLTSDDKLRKQLLGKDYAKLAKNPKHIHDGRGVTGHVGPMGSKPRPTLEKRNVDEGDSDEEGGRSSLGKQKRRKYEKALIVEDEQEGTMGALEGEQIHGKQGARDHSKTVISYLDEVLLRKQGTKKEKKKKKKKKKKTGGAQVGPND